MIDGKKNNLKTFANFCLWYVDVVENKKYPPLPSLILQSYVKAEIITPLLGFNCLEFLWYFVYLFRMVLGVETHNIPLTPGQQPAPYSQPTFARPNNRSDLSQVSENILS